MNPSSGSVLIAERYHTGHRLVYVRLLIEGALRCGYTPVLAIPRSAVVSPEYRQHLAGLGQQFTVVHTKPDISVRGLQLLAADYGVERLIIPDSNWRVMQLALGRRVKRAPRTLTLMMRDPRWELQDLERARLRLRLKLLVFRLAAARSIADVVWLREPGHSSSEPHANDPVLLEATVDDIIADAEKYRDLHGLTKDIYWFGIAGVISEAKQVPLVARAVAMAAHDSNRRVGLALLGPLKASEESMSQLRLLVEEHGVALVTNFALHSNYDMNVAIASLDCVVAAYANTFGPSSTLGKAAALGVASIGAGPRSQQLFAERITGYRGVPLNVEDIAVSMVERMDGPKPARRVGLGPEQFLSALLG